MNKCRSSKHDENANTRVTVPNGHDDLSNYAEDALKEVLGWYGLQEGEGVQSSKEGKGLQSSGNSAQLNSGNQKPRRRNHTTTSQKPTINPTTVETSKTATSVSSSTNLLTSTKHVTTTADMGIKTDFNHIGSRAAKIMRQDPVDHIDNPLDLTNGNLIMSDCSNPSSSPVTKTSWTGHRKLIGMRFLFPPLSDDMPLIDRAKIWVRRHDYKYFVGWNEDELAAVDPLLRPLGTITPDMYKTHMNRSEYCRNVKLKYCLESDAEWAQEFRVMLTKSANDGGFTGLCQAKIAAAELWRKYSEKYRSHQARYPNPKSKCRSKKSRDQTMGGNDSDNSSTKRKSSAEESIELEDGSDDSQETKRGRLDDDLDMMYEDDSNLDVAKMHYESDECHEVGDVEHCRKALRDQTRIDCSSMRKDSTSDVISPTDSHLKQEDPSASRSNFLITSPSTTSKESLIGRAFFPHLAAPPLFGMPMPLFPAVQGHFAMVTRPDVPFSIDTHNYRIATSTETASTLSSSFTKPRQSERTHEYKRSERGLSFLFPSLSDHNLSLMDKVKITVLRHKNNYFLGKTEEELLNVDTLIRPKMPVTADIYKEYCHRNAMKYDSNLQFAMESQENWAAEFRAKLLRPPSEGGFSSLCEVKLEAGRLWREYSGKYRMHNIVKWQMDLNSGVKGPKEPGDACDKQRGSVSSLDAVSQSPISPSEASDQDLRTTPLSVKLLSPQSSVESVESPAISRTFCSLDLAAFSRAHPTSLRITSPKNMATDISASLPEPQPDKQIDLTKLSRVHSMTRPEPTYQLSQTPMGPRSDDATPAAEKIQEVCRTTDEPRRHSDALFRPLPKHLNVSEQVSIWLERHRHNYFLGYQDDELANLSDLVRPTIRVTSEVFKRCIPESMIDIISKIELIMMSNDAWAIEFQERIGKSPKDGGFSTFEEALTEAVVLWNMAAHHQQLLMMHESRSTISGTDHQSSPLHSPDLPLDLQSPDRRLVKTELKSPNTSGNQKTNFKYGEAYIPAESPTKVEHIVERPSQGTSVMTKNSSDTSSSPNISVYDRSMIVKDLLNVVWSLRGYLQQQSSDNAYKSWSDRLLPHMATLRSVLGSDYRPPPSAPHCVVDLILSTLHQHIQHITDTVPARSDVLPPSSIS